MEILHKRKDGTFVATVNGMPYHIIPEDPLFAKAQIDGVDAPLEALKPQPSAEQVLAAKVEETVAELAAESEQKRLDAIKEAVKGEFKDTKSEKDVSDKLAQLKAARKA